MFESSNFAYGTILAVFSVWAVGCGDESPLQPERAPSSPTQAGDDSTPSDEAIARTAEDVETSDNFQVPFPDNDNFFSPPELVAAQPLQQVTHGETATVRVLGFVRVHGGEENALLSINGRMHVAGVGQVFGELEVLSVSEPAVTVQRGGERWSVGLFDQPRIASKANSLGNARRPTRPSFKEMASNPSRGNAVPDVPPLILPEPPDIPDLPDITLPGLPVPPALNASYDRLRRAFADLSDGNTP
jgi:hypothetical protein